MFTLPTHALPEPISQHLEAFSAQRPDWTPERVLSSALALFLLQNGVQDRAVSQVYLHAMFGELFIPASDDNQGGVS